MILLSNSSKAKIYSPHKQAHTQQNTNGTAYENDKDDDDENSESAKHFEYFRSGGERNYSLILTQRLVQFWENFQISLIVQILNRTGLKLLITAKIFQKASWILNNQCLEKESQNPSLHITSLLDVSAIYSTTRHFITANVTPYPE